MPKRMHLRKANIIHKTISKQSKLLEFFRILLQKFKNIFRSQTSKIISEQEVLLLNNLSKFGDKTAKDVMIARGSIIALQNNTDLSTLSDIINKFSHTRIFIYEDTIDNITGFVHIKDLFKLVTKKQTFNLNKILRKPIIATMPMKLIDLLKEMQQKRTHIAIVINEYGDTEGMVTIEDILEEICGDIDDEHDNISEDKNYKILNSNTIIANARADIDELENLLKVKLKNDKDEFETIGGMVLATAGSVPVKGAKINISDTVTVEVLESNERTLKKIKLILKNSKLGDG